MGSPSRGGGVSRLSLPTPFSPIFVCPSAYRNLSPVLLFTHQLLPTHLQFSSSDCPFCIHRPFTYISLLYKPSLCHFSFSDFERDKDFFPPEISHLPTSRKTEIFPPRSSPASEVKMTLLLLPCQAPGMG